MASRGELTDKRYVDLLARMGKTTALGAQVIHVAIILSVWGHWRAVALWVGATVVLGIWNVLVNAVVLKRLGVDWGEAVRVVFNLAITIVAAALTGWPMPVWFWLPFHAVAFDRFNPRTVSSLMIGVCCCLGGAGLLGDVPWIYPVAFSGIALACFHISRVRISVIGDMLHRADEQRVALEQAQRQMIDLAREAGMAEVATGILHNVGNALNSVNVSANVVTDRVRGSRVGTLRKVSQLLTEHRDGLARFLTEDPKGRQIPDLLSHLATSLEQEQSSQLSELRQLAGNIDHISCVVAAQQAHATRSGVVETHRVSDLVDEAIQLDGGLKANNGLTLVREDRDVRVTLDRHRLLEILVNLITNARQALMASARGDKVIHLRVLQPAAERFSIEVSDNGVGIAAEDAPRIFAQGFTTKRGGHGFGLHMCSLSARAMGGTLGFHSEGLGRGATFTVELPVRMPRDSVS